MASNEKPKKNLGKRSRFRNTATKEFYWKRSKEESGVEIEIKKPEIKKPFLCLGFLIVSAQSTALQVLL